MNPLLHSTLSYYFSFGKYFLFIVIIPQLNSKSMINLKFGNYYVWGIDYQDSEN